MTTIETIRAEIERRTYNAHEMPDSRPDKQFYEGKDVAYGEILAFLDTLPEQPVTECHDLEKGLDVDLEKEVTKFVLSKEYIEGKETPVLLTARHFYDLGCRHTAEMYDESEYNRQRAEEAELTKGLDEEISSYWNRATGFQPKFAVLELTKDDLAKVARHFAEWGAEHLRDITKKEGKK